jgi:hypothetical protein
MSGKAISHVQGKGSLAHNNREFSFKNVDQKRTKDNIVYKNQSIDEAYRECFGQSLEQFNKKQTRADRKINISYFEYLFGESPESQRAKSVLVGSNKQKSFYEALVQVGDMNDSKVGTANGELAAKCLDEYMKGFQQRNPNFYVFNAVLHMDEATPHLHIDYIPVCHHVRGMDTQNGLAKALEEMGHGKGKGAINEWRLSERKALEEICKVHGIETKEPEKGRGYSLTPDEYKAQIEAEKAQLEKDVEPMRELRRLRTKTEEIPLPKKMPMMDKPNMTYEDAVRAVEGNNAYIANEAEIKNIRINRNKVKKREDVVTEREDAVDGRERQLNIKEKNLLNRAETLAVKEKQVDGLYQKQLGLNQKHEQLQREYLTLYKKHNDMIKQVNETIDKGNEINTSLNTQIRSLQNDLVLERENLAEAVQGAYRGFRSAIQAIKMLRYDYANGTPNQYKANLNDRQKRLIDAVTNKAIEWAREDGQPKIADDMQKSMGISTSIEKAIKALEPKIKSYDQER